PPPPPPSPLFPYTTLFRSPAVSFHRAVDGEHIAFDRRPRPAVAGNGSAVMAFAVAFGGRGSGVGAVAAKNIIGNYGRSAVAKKRDRKSTRLNSSHLGISYA